MIDNTQAIHHMIKKMVKSSMEPKSVPILLETENS